MARLFVLVEGETEETFVNEVLAERLYSIGFGEVSAKLIGNARLKNRRGGIRPWSDAKRDILRHLRQDKGICVTTMVDYYGLPRGSKKDRAWPGREEATTLVFAQKAATIESAVMKEIESEMGKSWNPRQFVPFVVMHEFEGLLFSDCARFASGIARPDLQESLQGIRDGFESPEHINDSPETHPSQRILTMMPEYQKPLHGNVAALEIGLTSIHSECEHFRDWLTRLSQLA